jgi:hypothetical protein
MVKKALLIGCNYTGSSCALRGCINDVDNMKQFIINKFGYENKNITILIDSLPKNSPFFPNKNNIINEITKFTSTVKDGDELVLHYSGHGTQLSDRNKDEEDKKDEAICPSDFKSDSDFIIDDDLYKYIIEPICDKNIKMTVIFDCCHSGTALDLKYQYQCIRSIPKNLNKSISKEIIYQKVYYLCYTITGLPFYSYYYIPIIQNVQSTQYIQNKINNDYVNTFHIYSNYKEIKANVVLFSGCNDNQTSADTFENGQSVGAMSNAIRNTYVDGISYQDFLKNIRLYMENHSYTQIPQMTFGKMTDPNEKVLF